jgi:hypothetical protein
MVRRALNATVSAGAMAMCLVLLLASRARVSYADIPCNAQCGGTCCISDSIDCTIAQCVDLCSTLGPGIGCNVSQSTCEDGWSDEFCCNAQSMCIYVCSNGVQERVIHPCHHHNDPNCPV